MYKPTAILRPLLLVVLLGWLGIAQPAEAQQTDALLEGKVVDDTAQPVSDAQVLCPSPD